MSDIPEHDLITDLARAVLRTQEVFAKHNLPKIAALCLEPEAIATIVSKARNNSTYLSFGADPTTRRMVLHIVGVKIVEPSDE